MIDEADTAVILPPATCAGSNDGWPACSRISAGSTARIAVATPFEPVSTNASQPDLTSLSLAFARPANTFVLASTLTVCDLPSRPTSVIDDADTDVTLPAVP